MDEVLSVGDARFRKKSLAKVQSMFDQGVTVLFVSHNIQQVKAICDTAILLEKGILLPPAMWIPWLPCMRKNPAKRNKD